jgi:hypothetical protein
MIRDAHYRAGGGERHHFGGTRGNAERTQNFGRRPGNSQARPLSPSPCSVNQEPRTAKRVERLSWCEKYGAKCRLPLGAWAIERFDSDLNRGFRRAPDL